MTEDVVDHSLRRWLAPPFTAFVFALHPLLASIRPTTLLEDPGIPGHLAIGRAILATGAVPRVETFSFTADGRPWMAYNWLFDVGAAWLERLGGLPLFAAVCVLLHALVPVLVYRRMLRIGASVLPALLLTFVAYLVLWSHALARPHVLTYLFFAIFLDRLDDVHAGRRSPRTLWLLPPLAALWCNVHGGFALGVVLIGLFTASAAATAATTRHPRDVRMAGIFAAVGLLTALATLCNPYGWHLHADIARSFGDRDVTALLAEWRSPDFRTPNVPIMAFEGLILVTLAAVAYARTRIGSTEVLLLAFFLHGALVAVRNLSLFAIVAAPIVARLASDELAVRWPAFAARWRAIAAEQASLRSSITYLPLIAATFVALVLAGAIRVPRSLDGLRLTPGAAAYIAARPERFARPFNTDDLGGALLARFWPAVRVFVDDRLNAYDGDFLLRDYVTVLQAGPLWRDVLARWDVDAAIVDAGAPCTALLRVSPEWSEAYADERNAIFLRRPADVARRVADGNASDAVASVHRPVSAALLASDHPLLPSSAPTSPGRSPVHPSGRKPALLAPISHAVSVGGRE